jgi:acyl-CoA dehydrogenase
LEELRARAREEGLWNLCFTGEGGPGLSNLEYMPLAELMGINEWAPEVFNCNPPDSGNIALLDRFANPQQRERWLRPLLNGDIRSCFAMTEPGIASSDATNMRASAVRDGDDWVLTGKKWWISGPGNPACKFAIVMCRTEDEAKDAYHQHSMMIVPIDLPGVKIERQLTTFGFDHAPRGQSELHFESARVPDANVILGQGRGFEIAQSRLGGGRLHHAARCVGAAERALEMTCRRALARRAFGKTLASLGANSDKIADSRAQIEMTRLLVWKAADALDRLGAKGARSEISQAKIVAPTMAATVIDRAIQLHGAEGLSQDQPLGALYARIRSLRIVDGPDEVHLRVIARVELDKYRNNEETRQ